MIIRDLVAEDKSKIIDLLSNSNSLGQNTIIDKSLWEWKYENQLSGHYSKNLVAEKDVICGHIGLWSRDLCVDTKKIRAARVTDVFVDKNYRKQGIFGSLLNKTVEKLGTEEVDLIWAVPNDNSFRGLIAKGFGITTQIYELVSVLNPNSASKKLSRSFGFYYLLYFFFRIMSLNIFTNKYSSEFKELEKYKIKSVSGLEFDQLLPKYNNSYRYSFDTGGNFFSWRYDKHPLNKYNIFILENSEGNIISHIIVGVKDYASRKNLRVCNIMDFGCKEDETIAGYFLLHKIRILLRRSGVDLVRCYVPIKDNTNDIFKKSNFWFYKKHPFLTYCNDKKILASDLENADWHVTLGDTALI